MTSTPIRTIRSSKDYEEAVARIEELMDAKTGTPQAMELDVWATLVNLYESEMFPIQLPDPISAIRFRMEQACLAPRDLVPLIGSRAKVSEVLSGKRSLTLHMIRALHGHLHIPAEVLLQRSGADLPTTPEGINWSSFPVAEMARRGWFGALQKSSDLKGSAEELMRDLVSRAGGFEALPQALYRKNDGARQNAKTDKYSLMAWCLQVLATARGRELPVKYKPGTITEQWMHELALLSRFSDGPKLAREHLELHGVHLLYVPHLPKTHLDGVAMLLPNGTPIVAITLRYDRLDNFWFCLFHELAHVALHLNEPNTIFVDDLSIVDSKKTTSDPREQEADQWALRMLIPDAMWNNSPIGQVPERASALGVTTMAQELRISPAIIAGRVRKETGDFRRLTHFVGNGEVRKHFALKMAAG